MRSIHVSCSLLLVALGSACSDYELQHEEDFWADTGWSQEALCNDEEIDGEEIEADGSCEMPPQTGQFVPELQWRMDTFDEHPNSKSVMATPVVGHVTDDDGDGVWGSDGDIPDIAVVMYGSADVLRVISGDGSTVHWTRADNPQGQGSPAIADVDADGDPEVLVVTNDPSVIAYHHDGSQLWESDVLGESSWWSTDSYVAEYSSTVNVSDMDGDGRPEVIAGAAILDGATGNLVGAGEAGRGTSSSSGDVGTTSFAVDIDLDGTQEVVTGNALYNRSGRTLSSSAMGDGYVAVADFDGDPEGEIVVVRESTVTLHNHDWSVIWGPASFGSSQGGPPTVADFDGDGEPEVGVAGTSIYTVLDTDGSILWSRTTQDGTSGVTGSAVYDFEGDGIAEVVYADETTLWAFNGPDGEIKLEFGEHASNTWLEYPTIADVDGDGHADIVVGHNPYQGGKTYYGVSVISDSADSWTSTRPIWNQHAYHITNVDDDAGIPADAEINWESYNNFRSGDMHAGQGSAAPDLVPELLGFCETECYDGEIWVVVRLRNEGAADLTSPVSLSLTAGGTDLGTLTWDDGIGAGRASTSQHFEVEYELLGDAFELTADPTDAHWECDETDNTYAWEGALCP